MKLKRERTIPREGPLCVDCGRPTPPRSNWTRALAKLPIAARFLSNHHYRCRRCYRRRRRNDRRAPGGDGASKSLGEQNRPKTRR